MFNFSIFFPYSCTKNERRNLSEKHCLITGGSSGIGKWAAIEAVKLGANVSLIARNNDRLIKARDEISTYAISEKQKIQYFTLDISADYEHTEKTLCEVEKIMGAVYILINCAGTAICGTLENLSIKDAQYMVNLNFYGTLYTIKALLPRMKERKEGYIVITASQAALIGIYGLSVYSSTKFALRGLAESLYMEVKPHGIHVTLAMPPDTDTPGFEQEEKSKPLATSLISETGGLYKPEVVAEAIIRDTLDEKFFSTIGFKSGIVTALCSGMSPASSLSEVFLQSSVMGFMRLIAFYFSHSFLKIVKKCENIQ
ncbi:hypothetical protein PGB90_006953 [Kerria lacca]